MEHTHCLSPTRTKQPIDRAITPRRYARLFPDLPACAAEEEFLFALGRARGLCDCGDAEDSESSLGTEAAGWPLFGQFIAHDITADRSALQTHVDASQLTNARSPQLDLDCLYRDGPVGHPYLYSRADPAKLLVAPGGGDVVRNAEGTAIIGDPRNDSHTLMSQMHQARWCAVHSARVRRRRVPIGHGQIRHKYRLNDRTEPVPIFPDLLGLGSVPPDREVNWPLLFDAPGRPPAQRAKKLDGRLVRALIELPVAITGDCQVEDYHSLAVRDLQRGHGVALPSGETVATHMGVTPLTTREVGAGGSGDTPLWYYVLREADVREGGNRLGPVAARIVGEVLIGLIDLDPSSVRHAPDLWQPTATLIPLLTA